MPPPHQWNAATAVPITIFVIYMLVLLIGMLTELDAGFRHTVVILIDMLS